LRYCRGGKFYDGWQPGRAAVVARFASGDGDGVKVVAVLVTLATLRIMDFGGQA
jgi:hypothetical protein